MAQKVATATATPEIVPGTPVVPNEPGEQTQPPETAEVPNQPSADEGKSAAKEVAPVVPKPEEKKSGDEQPPTEPEFENEGPEGMRLSGVLVNTEELYMVVKSFVAARNIGDQFNLASTNTILDPGFLIVHVTKVVNRRADGEQVGVSANIIVIGDIGGASYPLPGYAPHQLMVTSIGTMMIGSTYHPAKPGDILIVGAHNHWTLHNTELAILEGGQIVVPEGIDSIGSVDTKWEKKVVSWKTDEDSAHTRLHKTPFSEWVAGSDSNTRFHRMTLAMVRLFKAVMTRQASLYASDQTALEALIVRLSTPDMDMTRAALLADFTDHAPMVRRFSDTVERMKVNDGGAQDWAAVSLAPIRVQAGTFVSRSAAPSVPVAPPKMSRWWFGDKSKKLALGTPDANFNLRTLFELDPQKFRFPTPEMLDFNDKQKALYEVAFDEVFGSGDIACLRNSLFAMFACFTGPNSRVKETSVMQPTAVPREIVALTKTNQTLGWTFSRANVFLQQIPLQGVSINSWESISPKEFGSLIVWLYQVNVFTYPTNTSGEIKNPNQRNIWDSVFGTRGLKGAEGN